MFTSSPWNDNEIPSNVMRRIETINIALDVAVPPKLLDRNLVIASWRWPMVLRIGEEWISDGFERYTRDRCAIHLLAAIVRRFDVLAIQGIGADALAVHEVMKLLGPHWAHMMTGLSRETTYRERTAIVFDVRKVLPHGLAGQIVLPGEGKKGSSKGEFLSKQFFRPPFFASFRCLDTAFTLVNQHLVFSEGDETVAEMRELGSWVGEVSSGAYWERNLIVVGQLQLIRTGSSIYKAFVEAGLHLPPDLRNVPTTVNMNRGPGTMSSAIAWRQRGQASDLSIPYIRGGVFNYHNDPVLGPVIGPDVDYLSRHLPVWVEFAVAPRRGISSQS